MGITLDAIYPPDVLSNTAERKICMVACNWMFTKARYIISNQQFREINSIAAPITRFIKAHFTSTTFKAEYVQRSLAESFSISLS